MKIIRKAFQVWHNGMLNYNPHEGYEIDSLPITYAETSSKAKSRAPELYDFAIDGEPHKFIDLKVRRYKNADIVLHDGKEVHRGRLIREMAEAERKAKRREKVMEFPDDSLFYIQNGYVGNAVLWWGLNSNDYVCDIELAQLYTKEEVLSKFVNGRESDIIWESKHALNGIKKIVDAQNLRTEFSA